MSDDLYRDEPHLEPEPLEPEESGGGRTVVAVIVGLLLVAALVLAAFFLLRGGDEQPVEPAPPVEPTTTAPETPQVTEEPAEVETSVAPEPEPTPTVTETVTETAEPADPVDSPTPTETAVDEDPADNTWTATESLPADFGDTEGLTPLHWEAPADGDLEAWVPTDEYMLACVDQPMSVTALESLQGGRTITTTGPELVMHESVLVFPNEDEAIAFMQEFEALARTCADAGPSEPVQLDDPSPIMRTQTSMEWVEDLGDYALTWTSWNEVMLDETDEEFVLFPGGTISLWVREGNVVAMAADAAEYSGDPMASEEAMANLMPAIEHVFAS